MQKYFANWQKRRISSKCCGNNRARVGWDARFPQKILWKVIGLGWGNVRGAKQTPPSKGHRFDFLRTLLKWCQPYSKISRVPGFQILVLEKNPGHEPGFQILVLEENPDRSNDSRPPEYFMYVVNYRDSLYNRKSFHNWLSSGGEFAVGCRTETLLRRKYKKI